MPRKPGPKTELPQERMERKTFTLDPLALRMLAALVSVKPGASESQVVRHAIRVAYDRYQKQVETA